MKSLYAKARIVIFVYLQNVKDVLGVEMWHCINELTMHILQNHIGLLSPNDWSNNKYYICISIESNMRTLLTNLFSSLTIGKRQEFETETHDVLSTYKKGKGSGIWKSQEVLSTYRKGGKGAGIWNRDSAL